MDIGDIDSRSVDTACDSRRNWNIATYDHNAYTESVVSNSGPTRKIDADELIDFVNRSLTISRPNPLYSAFLGLIHRETSVLY